MSNRPQRIQLSGQHVKIVPVDVAAHASALFAGSRDTELWRYLFNGPYSDEAEFREWLSGRATSEDSMSCCMNKQAAGSPAMTGFMPKRRFST